jgi:nitrous oxide reductase
MELHLTAGRRAEEERAEDMDEGDKTESGSSSSSSGKTKGKVKSGPVVTDMNTSLLLDKVADLDPTAGMEDCCICMEVKPQVTLPCAHSYCLACIEQW